MSVYVYPTDWRWFTFLRERPGLDEVNFWQPFAQVPFKALKAGDLFFFRLKAPRNDIAGVGIFEYSSVLPLSMAWDVFGEGNGFDNDIDFYNAIISYRARDAGWTLVPPVMLSCIVLRAPVFLDQSSWVTAPPEYSPTLTKGRSFGTDSEVAQRLSAWAMTQMHQHRVELIADKAAAKVSFTERLVRQRLGQGAFRFAVVDTYARRCAVTGERTLPILDAAHIQPVEKGGEHRLDNGLLLRSDVHRLFDLGYVTVDQQGQFRVSARLRGEWQNGKIYYDMDRIQVRMPEQLELRPSRDQLGWHNDVVFKG